MFERISASEKGFETILLFSLNCIHNIELEEVAIVIAIGITTTTMFATMIAMFM